jgi:hypothetical protein
MKQAVVKSIEQRPGIICLFMDFQTIEDKSGKVWILD